MAVSFHQTQGLPAEIILLITSFIDVVHEKETLVALSRVSKRFNALTAPYLYSNFDQTRHSSRRALLLLLRTILATPHLGRYVHAYTSELGDPRPCLVKMQDIAEPSDIVNFKKAIRKYAIHPDASDYKWISDALAAKWDALVAILLCVLPNLRTITLLRYQSRDEYPYFKAVLNRVAAWQQSQSSTSRQLNEDGLPYRNPLSQLRSVSFQHGLSRSRGLDLRSCLPLLKLPSISKVHLHEVAEARFDQLPSLGSSVTSTGDLVPLPKFKFHAEELQLILSAMSHGSLQRFLACFTSLKRFAYEYGNCKEDDWVYATGSQNSPFVPSGISTALGHLSDSLQEISVTYRWGYYSRRERPIGSLRSFKKLRKLRASAGILLGSRERLVNGDKAYYSFTQMQEFFERMPPSLERLTIQNCDLGIIEFLSKYLDGTWVKILPELKAIEVVFDWEAMVITPGDHIGDKEAALVAEQFELAYKHASDRGILLVVRVGELELDDEKYRAEFLNLLRLPECFL